MQIFVDNERENNAGWTYDVQVHDTGGEAREFQVRLAWADYNLWSPDGADRPVDVVRAALGYLFSQEPPAEVASAFDLGRIRRRYADADQAIPGLITRGRG